jgi:hypothetical protein
MSARDFINETLLPKLEPPISVSYLISIITNTNGRTGGIPTHNPAHKTCCLT